MSTAISSVEVVTSLENFLRRIRQWDHVQSIVASIPLFLVYINDDLNQDSILQSTLQMLPVVVLCFTLRFISQANSISLCRHMILLYRALHITC